METTFLRCRITPGQFSDEYAVEVQTHDGTGHSLFAFDEDLECKSFPVGDAHLDAWIQVDVLDSRGELCLVRLPQRTMENGDTLTVRVDQVKSISPREMA